MNEQMTDGPQLIVPEGLITERAKRCYEVKELERLGITPDADQRTALLVYISLIFRDNKTAELIPAGDENQIFLRHIIDSMELLLLLGFKKKATIIDIGSGGGFPAIPIRIFRPDLSFILTEPVRKKAAFLREVKSVLCLDNVEIHAGKSETLPPETQADYVISRGIGTLTKFAQLAGPLMKKDGRMYTYKPKPFAAELESITVNKDINGVEICEIAQYSLGSQGQEQNLVSMTFVQQG